MGVAALPLERRILGVKVDGLEDLPKALSALGNLQRGSVEYAIGRREIVTAARTFGEIKALPRDWAVTDDCDGVEFKGDLGDGAVATITDEEAGIVECFVAVSGTEDKVADIIYPEALDYALAHRTPKGVWHHDWERPIAKALESRALPPGDPALPKTRRNGEPWPADAGALWIKSQHNLGTQRGREALADIKFYGADLGWSIGYRIPPGGAKIDKHGVRHIKAIIINEYSPVLFGAHDDAQTGSIKHELGDRNPYLDDEGSGWQEEKGGTISVYLSGSLEESIDAVADAVGDFLTADDSGIDMSNCWARVVGTFTTGTSTGRVVFDVITYGDYDGEDGDDTPDLDDDDNYFAATWAADATGAVTLSNVHPVSITVAAQLKEDGTPTEPRIGDLILGDVKAWWADDAEVKVGKMLSRSSMQRIKAAHSALGELIAAAEPAPAAGKADPSQPHPYMADNGTCATCGLSATAAVHRMGMGGYKQDDILAMIGEGAEPLDAVKGMRDFADAVEADAKAAAKLGVTYEAYVAAKHDDAGPEPVAPPADADVDDGAVKVEAVPADVVAMLLEGERAIAGV